MIADNPFYVLELPLDCSAIEVERAGQRLLAMLEVGLEAAMSYPTPMGDQVRDADLVRRSMDSLRDPDRRLLHEVWAALDPGVSVPASVSSAAPPPRWVEALAALGFAPRRG